MKILILVFLCGFTLLSAQLNEQIIGQPIKIFVPKSMQKTFVLNSSAIAQFADDENENYLIIVQTEKEELQESTTIYENINEASTEYANMIFDSLINDKKRKKTSPKSINVNQYNATEILIEGAMEDYDYENNKELKTDLFYNLTFVETEKYYYQIISWCGLENKQKNMDSFRKIAQTFSEVK